MVNLGLVVGLDLLMVCKVYVIYEDDFVSVNFYLDYLILVWVDFKYLDWLFE